MSCGVVYRLRFARFGGTVGVELLVMVSWFMVEISLVALLAPSIYKIYIFYF